MDILAPIFEQIKKKEKRHKEKILVGLIDVTAEEYASLEKKAKEIMVSYKHHPYIYPAQCDILSIYAILFDMYKYSGDRFWESLAIHVGLDEKFVRDIIIEAMKTTFESRYWSFYQTTRNEYVETIRMHGIIGNDSSGDKIIYALYVIYLKDFEKEITSEKLDLFFPYLRKIFKKYEGSADENATTYDVNGITYIRGQIPKSFMHAFLLNPSAVATVLKNIFYYFEDMECGKSERCTINERFENKINVSFKRNDAFENEYTRAYIHKKPKRIPQKDKIEYQQRAVRLHVPRHFIDFQSNEDQNVVLKVFNFQHLLKTTPMNISSGGIGWKSDPIDLTFAKQYKNIRYTIEKKKTKEIIYDSKKELYQESVNESKKLKTKETSPIPDTKKEPLPLNTNVFTLHPNGERIETSLNELKPGYVYEISPPNGFSIDKADHKKTNESLFVLAMNRTEVYDGEMKYCIRPHKRMITFSREQYIPRLSVSVDDISYDILTGTNRVGIVMGFPYSLNELQLKVNDEIYGGLAIRKKLLKEVKLMDNGDFLYVMEISEGLKKQDTNMLQAYINIKGLQLKYVQQRFYYDPEWSFSYQHVQFQNKEYIQIDNVSQLDSSKEITNMDDTKLSLFLKQQDKPLQVILNKGKAKKENRSLSIKEIETAYLYDPDSKRTVTDDDKGRILSQLHDEWNEIIKELISLLLKDTSADSFIDNLMNNYLSFRDTFAGCLLEVDDEFTDHILSGLSNALFGEATADGKYNKYVKELIRILAAKQSEPATQRHIATALRAYQIPIEDEKLHGNINNVLHYHAPVSARKNELFSGEILLNDISPENQKLSLRLYRLATNPTLSEFDTILEVKDIQAEYPDKDAMSYYELIITFKLFISDKQLANSIVDRHLFMAMFYQFVIEYNRETICEFMNELEKHIDKKVNEQENLLIRERLIRVAKTLNLDVLITKTV
ncbi:Hypothetical protein Tpal_660 [Trichococcus palustris]|uniref:Uncharacterized protein n=1 Tax=Trichococcus palustris TaxID=140314 RepID=A0A143YA29_9LACT|nr:hypothetical protein [Trichococcus palustris]CZQ85632.1 Hypothetical protein Tpal_660 [Trichococcus palustris]SFK56455.1 hypothetical protein SAMN04488076_101143 [Trichococcus palustris]